MWCADCERVEQHLFNETVFWIYGPTEDVVAKLTAFFTDSEMKFSAVTSHILTTTVQQAYIDSFIMGMSGCLNGLELATTNIITTEKEAPTVEDMGRILPAKTFVNRYQSDWIIKSIEKENYESWYQPIVKVNRAGTVKPFAHEALFRMRDDEGDIVPPAHVFNLASHSDLLFTLDLVARRAAVDGAAKHKLKGKLFINFNPSSVYDPSYCLRKTASAINEAGLKPKDVVFEITETDAIKDQNHLKGILAYYRQTGFEVALDDIGSGWSGLNLLNKFRPDYVKIDMELIRDVHKDAYKQTIVKNLLLTAQENQTISIAEGIEIEEEFIWLRDNGADLFQGYYFGKPDPVPAYT